MVNDIGKPLGVIWILQPHLADNLKLLNGFSLVVAIC